MKITITDEGLLIPKEVAERLGSKEVEILEEPGRLVIVAGPVSSKAIEHLSGAERNDPILGLGQRPVRTGVQDGSTKHDRYIYDGANE